MKKMFLVQSSRSFTGFLWIYIFFSLLFFGNRSLGDDTNCNVGFHPHEHVLTILESQSAPTPSDYCFQLYHCNISIDNDDLQSGNFILNRISDPFSTKNPTPSIHQRKKNSSITIRMLSSVLIV
ncbi:MAG: hypothetical protein JW915_17360 [Chitinispirillaceae bacterium]|nr:hypothetical protein [Chitinispirillaceae bacterium]